MFAILADKTICLTRGDVANIEISANTQDGQMHTFRSGDVVRFLVYEKRECTSVVIKKDVSITKPTRIVSFQLDKDDTRFGEPIVFPTEYWYEVEVNPDTAPQTIVGYDEAGAKIFRLYPEGCGKA